MHVSTNTEPYVMTFNTPLLKVNPTYNKSGIWVEALSIITSKPISRFQQLLRDTELEPMLAMQ